jgi:hypothetical protein
MGQPLFHSRQITYLFSTIFGYGESLLLRCLSSTDISLADSNAFSFDTKQVC